ncbi:MAG: nei [Acidimicrobiales bacterium]|nr:nei [Acidimicrobiales bacterium]
MPEGDTIHRAAARLRPALVGHDLLRFDAPRLVGERPRPGTRVEAVEARGKHLLVDFAGGLTLQTHLRMSGSWHLYRTGERWQLPSHLVRALIEVEGWVAVCFSAPVVRTYRRDAPGGALGRDLDPVGHLGPDLCLADPDLDECLRRVRQLLAPETEIGVVLLDQRVACGVGNVYKSEVLHLCRVDPFAPVGALDESTRRTLLATAARLLRANLTTSRRTTISGPPGSVAVYGRQRQPCRRCGTPIRMRRQGEQARNTYWCPTCQT